MRILQLHNDYGFGIGGEDVVVKLEKNLLESHGHEVFQLIVVNDIESARSPIRRIGAAANAIWSKRSAKLAIDKIRDFCPDVVHVHNTFCELSPSVFSAIRKLGVPCVHSLHNWRFTCATSCLFRDGKICTQCLGRLPYKAIMNGCRYMGSRGVSTVIACTQFLHGLLGTYKKHIGGYIVFSEFQKSVAVLAGIPQEKVFVKPHFIPDPIIENESHVARKKQIVYAGGVSDHKGYDLILNAWVAGNRGDWKLVFVGESPEVVQLRERYEPHGVVFPGRLKRNDLLNLISESSWLAIPSKWYETFGLVMIEALALGTPVIAPDHAHFPEIISHGANGLLFEVNNVQSLNERIDSAICSDSSWDYLSRQARQAYLESFSPEQNYLQLIGIYRSLVDKR